MIKYGIHIKEIVHLSSFIEKAYIPPNSNQLIQRVSVIEVRKFRTWLRGGELALTTLYNFPSVSSQIDVLEQLIAGKSACLAFHPGIEDQQYNNGEKLVIHKETLELARKHKFPIILLRQQTTYADIIETIFKLDMDKQNKRINTLDIINQKLFHYLSNNISLDKIFNELGTLINDEIHLDEIHLLDPQLKPLISVQEFKESSILELLQMKEFKKFFNKKSIMKLL